MTHCTRVRTHTFGLPSFYVRAPLVTKVCCSREKFSMVWLHVRIAGRTPFHLLQRIRAFVFLAHSVHDEHDDQNGAQQPDDGATDDSCIEVEEKGWISVVHVRDFRKDSVLAAAL